MREIIRHLERERAPHSPVCFGGVSLAIYMYGIRKEILKLVRASAASIPSWTALSDGRRNFLKGFTARRRVGRRHQWRRATPWGRCAICGSITPMSTGCSLRMPGPARQASSSLASDWFMGATGFWEPIKDREVRRNLSRFLRSRGSDRPSAAHECPSSCTRPSPEWSISK
jgi:hypothetical protein